MRGSLVPHTVYSMRAVNYFEIKMLGSSSRLSETLRALNLQLLSCNDSKQCQCVYPTLFQVFLGVLTTIDQWSQLRYACWRTCLASSACLMLWCPSSTETSQGILKEYRLSLELTSFGPPTASLSAPRYLRAMVILNPLLGQINA